MLLKETVLNGEVETASESDSSTNLSLISIDIETVHRDHNTTNQAHTWLEKYTNLIKKLFGYDKRSNNSKMFTDERELNIEYLLKSPYLFIGNELNKY